MASTELKVPSDPKHCFFFDLPVEIRIKIYKYCLVFDEVVEIKQIEHTRTAREHHATCTLEVPLKSSRMLTSGRASFRKKFTRRFYDEKVPRHTICCEPEESFMLDSPVEIHYFQGPETVLSLTETCKLLFEEALPIFFAYNTLHLEFRILADYLRNKETGNRGRFIRGLEKIDIWISTHTECTIEFLHSCHDLQSLTLNFLVTEPDESEKKFGLEKLIVAIFTSLAFVRGLKHLSLRVSRCWFASMKAPARRFGSV